VREDFHDDKDYIHTGGHSLLQCACKYAGTVDECFLELSILIVTKIGLS